MIVIPFLCAGGFLLLASWVLTVMVTEADARANWEPYWVGALVSLMLGVLCCIIALLTLPTPK